MTQTERTMRAEAFGRAREELGQQASIEAVNARAQEIYEAMEAVKAGMSFISNRGKQQ